MSILTERAKQIESDLRQAMPDEKPSVEWDYYRSGGKYDYFDICATRLIRGQEYMVNVRVTGLFLETDADPVATIAQNIQDEFSRVSQGQ